LERVPGGKRKGGVKTAADRVLPDNTVRISMLGPLEVSDTAGRPVRVGGHRVRALLILLALDAGRVLPSHALIDRLWPQERPADAANALQSLVSRLRLALRQAGLPEGVVESTPVGYRLAVPPEAVDAIAFESQARAGSQALAKGDAREASTLLRAALKKWRGSALTDVAGEEFAFAPTARLSELQAAATLDRVEADLVLGTADAAMIGELRELTAADQLAERPTALLMRALAATGRQSEALAMYQRTREHLADRLGVDPSPQLEQVYLAILRQEIPPTAAPLPPSGPGTLSTGTLSTDTPAASSQAEPRRPAAVGGPRTANVRRPPTSFIGRDDDVTGVLKRLGHERLVTLTGPGGVGKTRLSTEVAARVTIPAWLTELAPVTDPAEVPYAVLDTLGLRERSIAPRGGDMAGDPVDRLCSALTDRDAVLILDNCEHVIDAAAALAARLLSDCPNVKILATSREPLQIPGEALHVVAPLAAPLEADIPEISGTYPAVRLFTDRAAAVLPGFELETTNAEPVARICRNLDGMPLAIELAAPWLRTLTPAQLAARLDDRFSLLTGGSRIALPRHQTLRAVVDWSWDLLSERERVLARRLAVFPGGATLALAERVCAGQPGQEPGPLPASAVLPTLAGLVGKSLLTRADGQPDNEPRYRMLETVRAYGLERLAEANEDTPTRDAAARYYLELAETADPLLRTKTQAHWFHVLTAEQDNVNAAVRWSIARQDAASALRFVRALGYYWVQRGQGEADALSREILAMTPPPLTKELAEARVICALLAAGWNWNIDLIRDQLDEALAALKDFGTDYASVHPMAAQAEPLLMQYDGATDQAQQFIERYAAVRDPWLHAMGQIYVSAYAMSLGRLDGAEDHCRAGLAEMRTLGEQWGVAIALTQIAEFTELRADHAAAIAAITEAASIGRQLGVWGDLTYVEARLAVIHARAGDLERGYAEIARVRRTMEARGAQVDSDRWVTFMLAELASLAGDYAEAARCCESVLALISGNQARWWESLRAQVKARLAIGLLKQGHSERCERLLTESLDSATAGSDHPALAAVVDACAVYILARGSRDDGNRKAAEQAARLLGAAHAIRGAFDESSLDAPPARAEAREALGPEGFDAAYESTLTSTYESALTLVRDLLFAA
jgi:predicted ATPase/DNA-binding SARP family transcriptional activator